MFFYLNLLARCKDHFQNSSWWCIQEHWFLINNNNSCPFISTVSITYGVRKWVTVRTISPHKYHTVKRPKAKHCYHHDVTRFISVCYNKYLTEILMQQWTSTISRGVFKDTLTSHISDSCWTATFIIKQHYVNHKVSVTYFSQSSGFDLPTAELQQKTKNLVKFLLDSCWNSDRKYETGAREERKCEGVSQTTALDTLDIFECTTNQSFGNGHCSCITSQHKDGKKTQHKIMINWKEMYAMFAAISIEMK